MEDPCDERLADVQEEDDLEELPNGHCNGILGANGGLEEVEDEQEDEEMEDGALRAGGGSSSSSLGFPISRVRRLIKSESEIQMVGVEAIFAIAKAAELFLEQFVEESFDRMIEENRTTLAYKDLSSTVASTERLEFLADFVPEKVPASKALAEAPFQIS